MRVNHEIRVPKVRVVTQTGEQLGVLSLHEALALAEQQGLDLVEIVATAVPPVCKIIDYGKFRYDQTKREKESKKSQHQVKVKELKFSPNISEHDLDVKTKQAKKFLEEGNKVKISCVFRGREMMHPEFGSRILDKLVQELDELSTCEAPAKMFGRMMTTVLAPAQKKKK
ncbi:MAG: translation initiation factor IF-3 [Verrucomicrobia bacterium]|nr:translation initiation factor IF-3 [Verrucomicrobiota bacterium]MBS0637762.1 translation initiation factor IF-3 [Verrucomicrobiota bacterium]